MEEGESYKTVGHKIKIKTHEKDKMICSFRK